LLWYTPFHWLMTLSREIVLLRYAAQLSFSEIQHTRELAQKPNIPGIGAFTSEPGSKGSLQCSHHCPDRLQFIIVDGMAHVRVEPRGDGTSLSLKDLR
jgi:hypothetical protein